MGYEVCVIANPVAGYGRSGKCLPEARAMLDSLNVRYEIVETERPGQARDIALERCNSGSKVIAAMGGDGTLNEVVNGVLLSGVPGVAVATIPAGTGNDFAGGNCLFSDWTESIGALASPSIWNVDVLLAEDARGFRRYVINSVGIGFDAYVVKRVCDLKSRKIGKMSYMIEALRGLLQFAPGDMTIVADAREEAHVGVWLFALTNSGNFGGGMRVSPDAIADDGKMDVALLQGVPRMALVSLLFLVRSGKHVGRPGVFLRQAEEVAIQAPPGFPCHIDGDVVDVTYPVRVRVVHRGLPLVRSRRSIEDGPTT